MTNERMSAGNQIQAQTGVPAKLPSISLRPGGGGFPSLSLRPRTGSDGGGFVLKPGNIAFQGSEDSVKDGPRIKYTRAQLLSWQQSGNVAPAEVADSGLGLEDPRDPGDDEWQRSTPASVPQVEVKPPEADERDWRLRQPLPPLPVSAKGSDEGRDVVEDSGRRPDGDRNSKRKDTQARPQVQASPQYPSTDVKGEAPAIVKAAVPWAPRRELDQREGVLRTVKGILNKLTPEKFEVLLEQMPRAGITTPEILKMVISLIFKKAVVEPTFCAMYAELCARLATALPEFPPPTPSERPISFKQVLLNTCQDEFETAANQLSAVRSMMQPEQEAERLEKERVLKLDRLGNIRLIGELFRQHMIPERIVLVCINDLIDDKKPAGKLAEEDVEALVQLLNTIGKDLDQSTKSMEKIEAHYRKVEELSRSPSMSSRIRFKCRDLIELRQAKWVPRRETVSAKTLALIHAEAEAKLGLRPGTAAAALRSSGVPLSSSEVMFPMGPTWGGQQATATNRKGPLLSMDMDEWDSMGPVTRPRRRSALPGTRVSSNSSLLPPPKLFEGRSSALLVGSSLPSSKSPSPLNAPPATAAIPREVLPDSKLAAPQDGKVGPERAKKLEASVRSMVEEFMNVRDLKEALQCVLDMKVPLSWQPSLVLQVAMAALEARAERDHDDYAKLLAYLVAQRVVAAESLGEGLQLLGPLLDDLTVDAPLAPRHAGRLLGACVVEGALQLTLLGKLLEPVEDDLIRRGVVGSCLKKVQQGGKVGKGGVLAMCQDSGLSLSTLLAAPQDEPLTAKAVRAALEREGVTLPQVQFDV